jgi:hypothetical protein
MSDRRKHLLPTLRARERNSFFGNAEFSNLELGIGPEIAVLKENERGDSQVAIAARMLQKGDAPVLMCPVGSSG